MPAIMIFGVYLLQTILTGCKNPTRKWIGKYSLRSGANNGDYILCWRCFYFLQHKLHPGAITVGVHSVRNR